VHAEELEPATAVGAARWRVIVEGRLSFLSVPRLSQVLGHIPPGSHVVVELVVDYLDHAAYEHLHAWQDRHRAGGGIVVIDEVGLERLADRSGTAPEHPTGRRRAAHFHLPRWFSPWSHWQETSGEHTGGVGSLAPVLAGLSEYHRRSAPLVAPFLAQMVDRRHASGLFLTCGDSRVLPNLLTSSGPGDLYTVRNIGNLVPPYNDAQPFDLLSPPDVADVSVAAALEYAIGVLKVPAILVCGHSKCGAMQALLARADEEDGSLGRWLRMAGPSLQRWRDGDPVATAAAADGRDDLEQLAMVNIVQQLDNLRTHPMVNAAIREGQLDIAGLYFDIATARILLFDPAEHRFVPAPEHSRDLPAALRSSRR
jgi:carbonic anhydrase